MCGPSRGERVGLDVLPAPRRGAGAVGDAAEVARDEAVAVRIDSSGRTGCRCPSCAGRTAPDTARPRPPRWRGGRSCWRPWHSARGRGPSAAPTTGSQRSRGIVLFANGRPVSGSRTVPPKMPCRSFEVRDDGSAAHALGDARHFEVAEEERAALDDRSADVCRRTCSACCPLSADSDAS